METSKFLNSRGCWSGSGKFIWSTKAPYRVNVFLWLVGKEAINTWDNLNVRGWQGPYICSLCGIDVETTVHLFITCEFAWSIWTVVDVSMLSVCDLILQICGTRSFEDKESRSLKLTKVAALLWNI